MRTTLLTAIVTLLTVLTGCDKKVVVNQAPVYWPPHVKTVLVLPFRNTTPDPAAGLAVSDAFASALAARNVCQVLTRNDCRDLADDATLQQWLREDDRALAARFQKWGRAQALIVGTVSAYSAAATSDPGRQPLTAVDPDGRQRVVGYKAVPVPASHAEVASTVQLMDLNGQVIYAVSPPVRRTIHSPGAPAPAADPGACRAQALNEVVGALAAPFSPVQRQVAMDQGKSFFTVSGKADGAWKKTKKFDVSSAEVTLVVQLPPSCAGNRFQVVISRKPTKHVAAADVAVQDIVWRAEDSANGLVLRFPMAQLLQAGGGIGDYTAKFLANGQVTMHQDFKIAQRS